MNCPNCDYPLDTVKIDHPAVSSVSVNKNGVITEIRLIYPVNGGIVEISCENCGYDVKSLIKDKNKIFDPCEW